MIHVSIRVAMDDEVDEVDACPECEGLGRVTAAARVEQDSLSAEYMTDVYEKVIEVVTDPDRWAPQC
tara:strand:- start:1345 stop:1545 length:201 start_codon:yes stop_codon:yes gene_type:complete